MPADVMNYIECDVPEATTLVEWRRARIASAPRRRWSLRARHAA